MHQTNLFFFVQWEEVISLALPSILSCQLARLLLPENFVLHTRCRHKEYYV